jgi:hypothetical protein
MENILSVSAQVKDWNSVPGCIVDNVPTLKCLEVVYGNLLFMSSTILMIVLFLMFLWGGVTYLTSFGSPDKMKKAQGTIKYALLGFVLYLSAFVIIKTIDVVFLGNRGTLFQFSIGPSPTP